MKIEVTAKKALIAAGLLLVVGLVSAYDRPDRFSYRIVFDEPDRVESQVNSLARDGWEPISMSSGGAVPISGSMNSATRHGSWVYVMLRRPR